MHRRPLLPLVVGVTFGVVLGCSPKPVETPAPDAVPGPNAAAPSRAEPPSPRVVVPPASPPDAPLPTGLDPADPRLPDGAVARLGSEAGKPRRGWNRVVLLPDGKRLLAPHSRHPRTRHSLGHYTLYDLDGLKPIGEPILFESNPGGGVGDIVCVSGDGRRMASYSPTHVAVHDVASGKRLMQVPRPGQSSGALALSRDGSLLAVGGGYDHTRGSVPLEAAVWNVDGQNIVCRVTAVQNQNVGVELTPDGKTLLTRGMHRGGNPSEPDHPSNVTQIWDVPSAKEVGRVKWPTNRGRLVFGPNSGTALFQSHSPHALFLVDPRTGLTLHTLADAEPAFVATAFSPDGTVVAAAGAVTCRWEVATGRLIDRTPRPADVPPGVVPTQIAFAAPDRVTAVGVVGLRLHGWDALTGQRLTPVGDGHDDRVSAVAFTADAAEVYTGGFDATVYRWEAKTGRLLGRVDLRDATNVLPQPVHLSTNGARAFTQKAAHDPRTGKRLGDYLSLWSSTDQLAGRFPAPTGGRLAVMGWAFAGKPVRCVVYDADAAKLVAEFTLPPTASAVYAALAPGGRRLATASTTAGDGGKLSITVSGWDVDTGGKLGEVVLPNAGGVFGFAAIDDTRFVVGTGYGRVVVADVATGKVTGEIPDADRVACRTVTVAPDGKSVAVFQTMRGGNYGSAVRVYDVATGAVRHTIEFPTLLDAFDESENSHRPPQLMAFSPDGATLAVPATTSVVLWNLTMFGPAGLLSPR